MFRDDSGAGGEAKDEEHPSGAEAQFIHALLMAHLKTRPFKTSGGMKGCEGEWTVFPPISRKNAESARHPADMECVLSPVSESRPPHQGQRPVLGDPGTGVPNRYWVAGEDNSGLKAG